MEGERGYQKHDGHIVDYEMYPLAGVEGRFRGPPVSRQEYIAFLGGAQTFGRFVTKPFPALISKALDIDTLNLGSGGAGPVFFLGNPEMMDYANRARLVVVQVLSGRSQSNSIFKMFQAIGGGHQGINTINGRRMTSDQFYTWLMVQGEDLRRKIIDETRKNYVAAMQELLRAIKPPKILLWISTRTPDYKEELRLPLEGLFGAYPQLLNQAMIEELRGCADIYVECVSRRGWPQPLVDRSGNPASVQARRVSGEITITHNRYYPSPEMHEDAAALLVPACRELLARQHAEAAGAQVAAM